MRKMEKILKFLYHCVEIPVAEFIYNNGLTFMTYVCKFFLLVK